jgi:hypothetical protein
VPDSPEASALPTVAPSLQYRRPAVRDLAWLVLDGALRLPADAGALATVALDAAEQAEFAVMLQQWDLDPEDAWLGPIDPRLRLGLYAEQLIGAWLRQSRRIRLLAMNWPLRANRITLGEADFLVRRQSPDGQELQLWEVACKFYLRVDDRGWVGPGLNDSLGAKLARVRGHQLQLIHHPGFRSAWDGDWSARAWMAGWLLDTAASLAQAPTRGVAAAWAEAGDVSLEIAEAHAREVRVAQWWLLPKRRWLRPVFADEPVAQCFHNLGEAASFLTAAFSPRDRASGEPRPLMLAGVRWLDAAASTRGTPREETRFRAEEGPGVAIEVMRLMLVPPGWTRRAAAMPPDDGPGSSG